MPHTTITINDALYFDLFDNIKYEWLKEVLDPEMDRDEYDFDIEIESLGNDMPAWCTTRFSFELRQVDYIRFGETHYKTKTFKVDKEYNGSSATALKMCGIWQDITDQESDEENDEEKNDEE